MAIIRALLLSGIAAGLLAGLVATVVQPWTTTPLILEAERHEGAAEISHPHEHGGRADAAARQFGTALTNAVVGAGFGLVLVAGFALRGEAPGARRGVLWGAAGFAAFALMPALGLPPELPGRAAAPLAARQLWWIATALATVLGLWLLAFGGPGRRWAGLALLPLPHLIGAPGAEAVGGPAPPGLAARFALASLLVGGVFWATLGAAAGWLASRHETVPRDDGPAVGG